LRLLPVGKLLSARGLVLAGRSGGEAALAFARRLLASKKGGEALSLE
jgi:hypothetical protein